MDRERLTITLRKAILEKIDSFIDGTKIRNRSHAIEYLVTQSLTPKVYQAVVLCGGKGLHMRPFTFEMPKGLLPVAGKPILEHIVELLRDHDVRDIIFSIGHLGEKIQEHFGDGKKYGVSITYVKETKPLGTGGALKLAQPCIHSDTFLVLHGDILVTIDLSGLIKFHVDQETRATIALTSVVDPSSYGEVNVRGAKITQFIEKPAKGKQTSQLISCGIYVCDKNIFSDIPDHRLSHLEAIFPRLAQEKQLSGFIFDGTWIDVGTPASYERAIREWRSKEA